MIDYGREYPDTDAWQDVEGTLHYGVSSNGSGPPEGEDHPVAEPSLADRYVPIGWHDLWSTTTAEPDWLIPGILERGRLHAIYAPRKQKKSLLTLAMVAALAAGRPLLGRPNPHGRPLRVLYVDIENAREDIRERLQDSGYGPDELGNLIYMSFPALPGLDSPLGGAHLLALVERYRPDLVVLDTTSRVVTGKENDADTFRALYRHALAPVKALGVAILRLDHVGKDVTLGQRGSSAKGDDLDTAWYLTVRSPDRLTLRLDFQRTNHHPAEIELVQHGSPLRFLRIDAAADRPEVAALLAQLDSLGVPVDAGRPTAQKALTAAGIAATASVLAEAVKIRKSCSARSRTGVSEDDHTEIIPTCSDRDRGNDDCAGKSCSEQSANSSNSEAGSEHAGAVRDLPVYEVHRHRTAPPQDCAADPAQDPDAAALELLHTAFGARLIPTGYDN